jgi:CDP-glycerol glycerophosphotransferase (TagB/SpsB family)
MPPGSRLRAAGRAGLARLPGPVRARVLGTLGARAGLSAAGIGLVTVVVVVEPGDRPDETLASVRGQTHPLLDVVVCPVGTASVDLPDDPRFRARPPVATSYDAANDGSGTAAGSYLVLLRGCDVLLPGAVEALAGSLAASGSDVATGVLLQTGEDEPWLARAQAETHTVTHRAAPASSERAADLGLANKVFRRDHARRLRLTEADDWLCSPTLAHVLPTSTVDVLDRPVVRYAHERGRRPYGAQPSPLPSLDHWLRLDSLVTGAVAGTTLAEGWRRHWYDVVLPRFVADAERADLATWRRLVELADAPSDLELTAASRALLWLARDDRRGDVEALAAELATLGHDVPTELTTEGLVARWRSVTLPDDLALLSEAETSLRVRVVRSAPTPDGRSVDLFVHIGGLDLVRHPLDIGARADGAALTVTPGTDATANRWAGARFQSAAEGAVRIQVPGSARSIELEASSGSLRRRRVVELPEQPGSSSPTSGPVVEAITLDGDRLVVHLTEPAGGLRLVGPGVDTVGEPDRDGTVVFDAGRDLYGRQTWLPTARYRLERPGGLRASRLWRDRLPVEVVGTRHRLRVLPAGEGPGELYLGPPRADDELGAFGQEQLRASYAVDQRPTDPDVWYFESFAGRSATDTPFAVFDELRRRRPDLEPVWGVLDHGHWAPPGSRPVVIGSRGWYDVLGTARVVVTNTEVEEWYRRRPDQLVVQCFHGYPSKAMGESQWRARSLPPSRLAAMRKRSVESWDLISTPTPEMTEVYREQYGYRGPAAEHGYPRNDALRGPGTDRLRDDARRGLGIRPDQSVVLYAPTWRDHLAVRPRAAAMSDHLDVERLASALGDSHVVLVRGHRFHAPGSFGHGVIDVTDHPEINELVLASDVAVLDYSSLRFDYAITGRPMVFLVPDLADYTEGVRGFLFPFTETAPGPLVSTTDEVAAHVRDVPGLAAAWGDRVAAFDASYNPWQDGHASERMLDAILELLG